ncbi:MAG TPA: VF530 family protein [Kofleriaceae bacterium]|nr:VF530 family protein [Kofleriaceae bacterium]
MTHDPPKRQANNPLHGITLERIVTELVEHFGWPALGHEVRIKCFTTDPSISSSLKFLRKTPWARAKVESLYLFMLRDKKRRSHDEP